VSTTPSPEIKFRKW